MSTGGIFKLITNDGKQDRMLMATAVLNNRLKMVREYRQNNPEYRDPTPTLLDIEKTHILFTNAHFKPFAAIGYEYNKVRPTSGNPQLGNTVQFSIPQFGDFFNDMCLHVKLRQPTLATTEAYAADQPLMRWCAYPGERLMKNVKFEVNGNPLDEYSSHAINFHREYVVQPNKKAGWNRCVGQEMTEQGYLDQPNWVDSGVAPADISHRVKSSACSGAQTPSGQKSGSLELFVPLLFWCNTDPRLSVPSVAIPYGQRFINVELAAMEELVGLVPRGANAGNWAATGGTLTSPTNGMVELIELYINNIFVNPEVHDVFIKRIGFTLIRVHRQQTFSADKSSDEVLLQQLKWPIEALFVGMKIRDYNESTSALRHQHLDKWHTFSQVTKTVRASQGYRSGQVSVAGTGAALLTTGTLTCSIAGTYLIATGNGDTATELELFAGDILSHSGNEYVVAYVDATGANDVVVFANLSSAAESVAANAVDLLIAGFNVLRASQAEVSNTVDVCAKTVDTLGITAHGIPIYADFPTGFYNAYLPNTYGGPNLNTPDDCSTLFVPFCLYPGSYQPSGHINVSRAREFYLKYDSSVIGNGNDGTLVVVASAINFLLISDGSAVLRYST